MRRIYFGFILLLLSAGVFGQCPSTSFHLPSDTVCTGNPLMLTNTTTPDSNLVYSWDFAAGDMANTPTSTNIALTGNQYADGFSIVFDAETDSIFGFASDYLGNSIYRLDFGNNIDSNPIPINLGLTLNHAYGSDFIKVNGNWYGFVCDFGTSVYRLDFGNSLSNTPTVTTLSPPGLSFCGSIVIREEYGKFYGFVADYNISTGIFRLDFGTDIMSIPNNTLLPISNLVNPTYLTIKKFCDKWVGLISNWGNGVITQISLDSLTSPITPVSLGVLSNVSTTGTGVDLIEEDCNIYGFVSYNSDNNFYELSYGSAITNAPTITTITATNSNARALKCINVNSKPRIFNVQSGGPSLTRWSFPNNSGSNYDTSTAISPNNIVFNQPGTYKISLTATDTITGANSSFCQTIVVQPNAPNIGFLIPDSCSTLPVIFTDTTSNIPNGTTWYWDFGDATHATNQSTTHNYLADGNYFVQHVANLNGCTDTVKSMVLFKNKPNAGFTDSSTCGGITDSVHFINTSTCNDNMTYSWDFGDGHNSTAINPNHHYASIGTYQVKLVATSDSGCVDSITIPVIISNPSGSGIHYSPTLICGNTQVDFIDTFVNTPSGYLWNFGVTPIVTSTLDSPSFSNYSPGTYTVTLIATTGSGCNDTAHVSLTVTPGPTAHFFSDTVCLGFPTKLTDLSSPAIFSDPIVSWEWIFKDSASVNSGADSVFYHTFDSCGRDTLFHTVITAEGCTGKDTQIVIVYCPPIANFTFTPVACNTSPVNFTDVSTFGSGDSITHWQWNFADSTPIDTHKNPSHTFANNGYYEVHLIVTNNLGCISSPDSGSIEIFPGPLPMFYIPNTNLCVGGVDTFTDLSLPQGLLSSWTWNFGDPGSGLNNTYNTFIDTNPFHQFNTSGIYHVTLTISEIINSNLTCYATDSALLSPINVHPIPVASFVDSNLCQGLPTIFWSTSTVPVSVFNDSINWWSWTWDTANNIGDTTYFTFPNSGIDTVTLEVQTDYCSNSITQLDTTQPAPTSAFTFTPSFATPGLPITFSNQSLNNDSSFWNFGDNTGILTVPNPIHIFDNNSCDTITLTTKNPDGCTASSFKVLCLEEAVLCLAVDSLSETITGNMMNVQALILNTGTVPINSFDVMVNVGGSILVLPFNDTLTHELPYSDTFRLNQSFIIDPYQAPTYVCVLAENPNGIVLDDTIVCVNEQCLDLAQQLLVFDLYPNPTSSTLTLDVVVPLSSEIIISVYDITGRLIEILYDKNTLNGYNQYLLHTESLAKGCYLLTVDFRDERVVKKFNKF